MKKILIFVFAVVPVLAYAQDRSSQFGVCSDGGYTGKCTAERNSKLIKTLYVSKSTDSFDTSKYAGNELLVIKDRGDIEVIHIKDVIAVLRPVSDFDQLKDRDNKFIATRIIDPNSKTEDLAVTPVSSDINTTEKFISDGDRHPGWGSLDNK